MCMCVRVVNPKLEEAKDIMKARKASVPTFLALALAAPLPADLDGELAAYLRDIIVSIKPVNDLSSVLPLREDTLDYVTFARALDYLISNILARLYLLVDHNSREMVSNYAMELLEKAMILIEEVHDESRNIARRSSSSGPSSSSGANTPIVGVGGSQVSASQQQQVSSEDIISSSQNRFILFLKHMAQSITAAAKKQVEEMLAKRDVASALAESVKEAAQHALALGEVLKLALFDPQAFKDNLASLVTSIKKASQYIGDAQQKDHILDCTRQLLEASILLQQRQQSGSSANSTPGTPSPHLLVFQAVKALLSALLGIISANPSSASQ